ncbi:hypothetical protein [Stenotrophomonas sp. ESTM1D_MKCIP4_1]|uniref:hypothetical protein n=1 Tax=Stenotrophomonas sp. ESTM1D_MKCIP4_1 TaxID=2072414 RepID=UPI00131F4259|nr:hypothetical protein [Stenotrophomonas sp. ESTM1D_MKCIP4_1]
MKKEKQEQQLHASGVRSVFRRKTALTPNSAPTTTPLLPSGRAMHEEAGRPASLDLTKRRPTAIAVAVRSLPQAAPQPPLQGTLNTQSA